MVSERKSEIEKERDRRIEFVEKQIEELKSEIQEIEFEAEIVEQDLKRLKHAETRVPVVSKSVNAGLNFVRRVKASLSNVDMSSDKAAIATLRDRTQSVKQAKQETKFIRILIDWIDLGLLRRRVEMMRSDMNSSPHELWRSERLRDILNACDESINRVRDSLIAFSMDSSEFPVSILARYLWCRMHVENDMKLAAWHCVARAHGWISEIERKQREQKQGNSTMKKKKK